MMITRMKMKTPMVFRLHQSILSELPFAAIALRLTVATATKYTALTV